MVHSRGGNSLQGFYRNSVEYLIRRGETKNMEERSKTIEEPFEQRYPIEELIENPLKCVEAIGYLNAIEEYFPSEQIWVKPKTTAILLALMLMIDKMRYLYVARI